MPTASSSYALDNPYQAPTAELIKKRTDEDTLPLFVVSTTKLFTMFVLTMGLYGLVWYYQHYKEIKQATGASLWPVPRAIFALFFTHNLFKRIHNEATSQNIPVKWSHTLLATAMVAMYLISYFAGDVSDIIYLVSYAFVPVMAFILVKVQRTANATQDDPDGSDNNSVTFLNVLWVALGLVLWLAVAVDVASRLGFFSLEGY